MFAVLALVLAGGCAPETVTFTEVKAEVLMTSCAASSCHGSANGTGGLALTDAGAYAAVVDVESQGEPGKILVVPGDAEASYLVHKLEGTHEVGDAMPPPAGGHDPEAIRRLKVWIDAGALDD